MLVLNLMWLFFGFVFILVRLSVWVCNLILVRWNRFWVDFGKLLNLFINFICNLNSVLLFFVLVICL